MQIGARARRVGFAPTAAAICIIWCAVCEIYSKYANPVLKAKMSDHETAGGVRSFRAGSDADAVAEGKVGALWVSRRRVLRRRAGVGPLHPVPVVPLGAVPLRRVVPPHPRLRHCKIHRHQT